MEYSVIVFDTAPTGHTLRFLSFPTVLEKALGKLSALSGRIGPMISQMTSLMGGQADAPEDMFAKLESMRAIITEVNTQFKDPVRSESQSLVNRVLISQTLTGEDDVRLRVHIRILVLVRDRAASPRTYRV